MSAFIGRRIKAARLRKELSQAELSQLCGWSNFPARISNYERGKREPKSQDLIKLSKILGVSVDWFYQESQEAELILREPQVTYGTPRYSPVLQWDQISDHLAGKIIPTESFAAIPHTYSHRTFALVIDNDTMTTGQEGGFPPGTIIIIDPELVAEPEDFVLAIQNQHNEYTFKQLERDGSQWFLKPLNTRYPLLELQDHAHVVGTMRLAIKIFC